MKKLLSILTIIAVLLLQITVFAAPEELQSTGTAETEQNQTSTEKDRPDRAKDLPPKEPLRAPDESVSNLVGEDIEIGEGEVKILSTGNQKQDTSVVGEDIEVGEGEAKIVSTGDQNQDAPVVGEDIEVGEGEAKIVSLEPENAASNNNNIIYYISAGIVILALAGFTTYKYKLSKPKA